MAPPLKDSFDADLVGRIAADLQAADPGFAAPDFVRDATRDFAALELSGRAQATARALDRHLPAEPTAAIRLIRRSLPPESLTATWRGMESFRLWPYTIYIAEHGIDCFDESMAAQYDITRRFTAEFSIRSFIEQRYEATMATLAEWARDENEHVRRLVSEGTRPRLPWAPVLRRFVADPTPILPLLDQLKDDESEYVRRSVANNLNDIAKDHPEVVLEVCRSWLTPSRRRLVRHALRGLVKAGNPQALAILGFAADTPVRVTSCVVSPSEVHIGDSVTVDIEVRNPAPTPQAVAVDLQVWFVRPSGARPRVFKGAEFLLTAQGSRTLTKRVSLRQMSTRAVHPGDHQVVPLVNGVADQSVTFTVIE